jgi:hypothetical protein
MRDVNARRRDKLARTPKNIGGRTGQLWLMLYHVPELLWLHIKNASKVRVIRERVTGLCANFALTLLPVLKLPGTFVAYGFGNVTPSRFYTFGVTLLQKTVDHLAVGVNTWSAFDFAEFFICALQIGYGTFEGALGVIQTLFDGLCLLMFVSYLYQT